MHTPQKPKLVLGISAFYHDSAAVLLVDGVIFAAVQEERFTRKKHDPRFPVQAIRYVLGEYGVTIEDVDVVVFYEKPYLKLERLLETYLALAPKGIRSFLASMPVWFGEKIFARREIWKGIEESHGGRLNHKPTLLFSNHHLSHAASAFYASPYQEAAILTVDGVGEWTTASIALGKGKTITPISHMDFPHSVGLLYSAFTYYCGFRVNSGEYKLMGLAPYGQRTSAQVRTYKEKILSELVKVHEDGSIRLNLAYFNFATGLTMCRNEKWHSLFEVPYRTEDREITQEYMNLALAIQEVTEEVLIRLARTARKLTGAKKLVLAGGVALNCVANSKLVEAGLFDSIWVQPAAGDAGGALGAAYVGHYLSGYGERQADDIHDAMEGSLLGPAYTDADVERLARTYNAPVRKYEDVDKLCSTVASLIAEGQVVGWVQGRMEWGPRALGNRSILGDPRNPAMQKTMNLKIKYREGFRPFAPIVLLEEVGKYFEWKGASPYMLFVAPVKKERRKPLRKEGTLYERLYAPRSDIPVVTHLDYSARLQTVDRATNERLWKLLHAFKQQTGYGVLVNTSFNVRGEPIVCSPKDAYHCFMGSEMDYLVIGTYVFDKKEQPEAVKNMVRKGPRELD
jgi:carbamoyltransferase